MSTFETRISALERAAKKPLPVYLVEFSDGTQSRMDALELLLHLDELDAGAEDIPGIKSIQHISGTLPTGAAWDILRKDIQKWQS